MIKTRNLVYIGLNRWDTIWQRPHHLAQNLSQTFRVLYVDPVAYSFPGYVYSRLKGNNARNLRSKLYTVNENLFVFTPPPLLPFSLDNGFINRFSHAILGQMVRRVLQRLDMQQPILWVTFPAHLPLIGTLGESLVGYDCMDNYQAFYAPETTRARLVIQQEEQLLIHSDVVVTTSDSLQQRLKKDHAHVYLVRNAVGDQFLKYQRDGQKPPADWPTGQGPVLGYIGSIAPWLDFEAIRQLATQHPDWRLVFIGPVDIDLTPYAHLKNLYFLGQKPYKVLVDYVSLFDVGLIPFQLNELTLDVNPVKVYEYFALGLAVVATSLPELMSFSNICYLANNTAEFIEKAEQAVKELNHSNAIEQQHLQAQCRFMAESNTWYARTTEIIGILEQHLVGQ